MYQSADKKRAEQLYGTNRTVDVSERRSVEIIEISDERREIELERLRKELDEISKQTEKIFEDSGIKVNERLERSVLQVLRDYLQKFSEINSKGIFR